MKRRSKGFCFPGYRYCGPGCSGPGAPVNAVDYCCQQHDKCYDRHGNIPYCDEKFHRCVEKFKNSNTKMGRDAKLFSNAVRLKNKYL